MEFTVSYEIAAPGDTDPIKDEMVVEAEDQERALEHVKNVVLEQEYPENSILLACQIVE